MAKFVVMGGRLGMEERDLLLPYLARVGQHGARKKPIYAG